LKEKILSHAKINVFLYVTSKREDGFHNLYSLMTRISLCDDIIVEHGRNGISISCDHPDVPEDESNLAYKAADLFYTSLPEPDINPDRGNGIAVTIVKRIPPGGGLGGGSSNAACVLACLNRKFNYPFSDQDLMRLGLKLGADVPFFLFGSPAIATGVGEKLEKIPCLKPYFLVLCDPGISACTADVYKNMDYRLTLTPKYYKNTGLNVLLREQETDVKNLAHNDLEESACSLYPEIGQTKEQMERALGRKVFMTGSGASLFALFADRSNAVRGFEKLAEKWEGTGKNVFLSSFEQE